MCVFELHIYIYNNRNSETGAGSSLVCESEVWSIHSNLVKEDEGKVIN